MRKDVKREYKANVKRLFIFLLIMLPILMFVSFCMSYFWNLSGFWNIFILIVVGGFGVLILELISKKVQEVKAKKPKKRDPFAD